MATCPVSSLSLVAPACRAVHYLVTGTFNTIALYLLAFDPLARSLTIHRRIAAQGPHQYLCTNPDRSRLYATTWAQSPTLSAWAFDDADTIRHINTVPITATGSYVSYFEDRLYSAGGPTGEVHEVDRQSGRLGQKVQELLFVPPNELASADKSRKALRYGAHSADVSRHGRKAFVAHLGHNSIYMYDVRRDGTLDLLSEVQSARPADAPRHCLPAPDGRYLYTVTEHTSFVDVYEIEGSHLRHIQTVSIIPDGYERHNFRGDTLRFGANAAEDGSLPLIASTRGKTIDDRGWVAVWKTDPATGRLSPAPDSAQQPARYQTRNSGGKANAIEPAFWASVGREVIILTDDQEGYLSILEYDGQDISMVDSVRLPGIAQDGTQEGASHAVWLS